MPHFVVIGAGQAGASLVAKLRAEGFEGDITLIGAEPVPPYQRPPLSKAYLLGEMEEGRLYLRPREWYAENRITLRPANFGPSATSSGPSAPKRSTVASGSLSPTLIVIDLHPSMLQLIERAI